MSTEENKAMVRRFVEEAFNKGNLAVLDELFAPDFIPRDTIFPVPRGPDGMKQIITALRPVFPDMLETIDDLIAEGDRVMWRWTARGTHKGALSGIPPTGKAVIWKGVAIMRVADGKFVEVWQVHDQLGLLQQLGATITPPTQSPG